MMIVEFSSKKIEDYFNSLFDGELFNLSLKDRKKAFREAVKITKKRLGENSVVYRRETPKERLERFEWLLKENKEANAPKLIIQDLEKLVSYWKKRCSKN